MAFTPINYIASYFGWTQFTPVLPKLYWDVYSAEERVKKICFELHKLCEYANMLADSINLDRTAIKEIETALANIENLDEIDEQVQALQETADTIQELLEGLPDYEQFATMQAELDEKPFVFDTVADMQECTYLSVGNVCFTNGFYSATDNGGGRYIVVESATENGMDVFSVNDEGAYAVLSADEVTPKMLGCVANGETDCTDIFKHMFENYNNVHITEGDYLVSSGYEINGVSNSVHIGSNTNLVIDMTATVRLKPHSLPRAEIFMIQSAENVTITGGNLIGDLDTHEDPNDTQQWGHGIFILNSRNVKIDDVHVSKCYGDGVTIGIETDNVIVSNCIITRNRRQGITVGSCTNVRIDGNTITDTGVYRGTLPKAGIDIEPDNGFVDNCVIVNNTFSGNYQHLTAYKNQHTTKIDNVSILGNTFTNEGEWYTLHITGGLTHLNIADNRMSLGDKGLLFGECSELVLNDNTISQNVGIRTILFNDCDDSIMSGNNITVTSAELTVCIRVEWCRNLTISNNTFKVTNGTAPKPSGTLIQLAATNDLTLRSSFCKVCDNNISGIACNVVFSISRTVSCLFSGNVIGTVYANALFLGTNTGNTAIIGNQFQSELPMFDSNSNNPCIAVDNVDGGGYEYQANVDISSQIIILQPDVTVENAYIVNDSIVFVQLVIPPITVGATEIAIIPASWAPSFNVDGILSARGQISDSTKTIRAYGMLRNSALRLSVWLSDDTTGSCVAQFMYPVRRKGTRRLADVG